MILVSSCSQESAIFNQSKTVFHAGDQQNWAAKNWNDQNWVSNLTYVPNGEVFWSRTYIDILKSAEDFHPYGIQLEVYGEYEVFWDGILIGKNGNPGQEATLGPEGKLWATFRIPTNLTEKGTHVMAIRSSLYYFSNHIGIYALEIDGYDALLTDQLIETSYVHIFSGAFLVASFYFLFLFLSNKREYRMLVFSISCFLFFALTMTQFIRTTVPIHYSLHVIRLEVIGGLMLSISFLIPLYFSMQFPYPKRRFILSSYAIILLYIFFSRHDLFGLVGNNMTSAMLIISFGIVIHAIFRKEKGAVLVFIILLLCLLIRSVTTFGVSLFAGFSLILLSMLYLLSLRIKEQRLAYENSLVQSTRLRLELLKKNIQPHFLMNTLTSLIDWIEEAPDKGVLFIEALAKEFDLFNQIGNKTLIPILQEIALCRTHLEIMEYRKEINYSLEEVDIDPKQEIPPAIIHTLLENGITHSLPRDDNSIHFRLVFESNSDYKCYTFLTYAHTITESMIIRKDGTGHKYVKARLTESYQDRWEFTSEPTKHGWKNTIKIYY